MLNKTLQHWITGCGWGVILRFAITFAVIGAVGVLMLAAAVIPLPRGVEREYVFLGAFILAIAAVMLTTIVAAVGMVVARGRSLDQAFAPLSVAGQAYLTSGRQWHGRYGGRRLDAYFYRGPRLDLYLDTPLQTRLGLAAKDKLQTSLAGLFKREPLALTEPDLQRLNVFALDETWARALLAAPEARAAIFNLLSDDDGREIRQVLLKPGGFELQIAYLRQARVTAENVQRWLAGLQAVARAAEALPAPTQTAQASAMERNSQHNRNAFTLPAILFVLGLLAVLSLCAFVPIVFILLAEAWR